MKIVFFSKRSLLLLLLITTFTVCACTVIYSYKRAISASKNGITIVIDAGHGGIDGGVTGSNSKIKESEINLKIAKMVASELKNRGYEAVLTRKDGNGLYEIGAKSKKLSDMQKRKEIILQADCDLMISIHQNFFPSPSVKGAQVFFAQNNEKSGVYAGIFQTELNVFCNQSKQCKIADYYVLQCSSVPSVLIECGFLSNAEDEAKLSTPSYRAQISSLIAATVDKIFFSSTTRMPA